MLRRTLFVLTVLAAALTFLAVGCSNDSTNNNDLNIGDANSPQFQATRTAINTAVDSTLTEVLSFVVNPHRFPVDTFDIRADLGITNPNDSVIYSYTNGWHVLYLGYATTANYQQTFVDSVRFFDGGFLQRYPTTATDEMDLIHNQISNYEGTATTYQNVKLWVNVNVTAYYTADQQFDGDSYLKLEDVVAGEQTDYEFDVAINDVGFEWHAGMDSSEIYPTSGSLDITATITQGENSQSWTINVDFSDSGIIDIAAIHNDTVYNYSLPTYGN